MPIPTPADFRDRTKKHSQMREMLAQMAENVIDKDQLILLASRVDLTDSNLSFSIHILVDMIARYLTEYDINFSSITQTVGDNQTLQENENVAIKSNITNLLLGFEQLIDCINTLSVQTEDKIAENNLTNHNYISNLLISISTLSLAIFESFDNVEAYGGLTKINSETILDLYLGLQSTNEAILSLLSLQPAEKDDLANLLIEQNKVVEFSKLDGFDPDISGSDPQKAENSLIFGQPNNLISIRLMGDVIPTAKGTVKRGSVIIDIDGTKINLPCTYEVQGNGSVQYPKKNLTIGFFKDETYVDSQSVKIGAVLPHDEWVFKANYIDSTHVRQISSYMLWSQMMEARKSWPQRDIDNYYVDKTGVNAIDTGAIGHPIGYPCVVYFNDEFYGIGDFQIGKKRANYNIPKNNPLMVQMEPDGQNIDITNWSNQPYEMKAPSQPTVDTLEAIRNWDIFAQSDQTDFNQNIGIHTNKINIVDYYLFVQFLAATDCVGANFNFVTWDGVQWFFMPYDLDSVYGLEVTGNVILNVVNQSMTEFSRPRQPSKDFWKKVEIAYATDINTRYAQLRDAGIFTVKNVLKNIHQLNDKYTADLFKAEYSKWPALPSVNITSIGQIASWVQARLVFLDTKFNY